MSAPQALPGGQYGHLTDAAAASSAAAAYSFDDYSALPFSGKDKLINCIYVHIKFEWGKWQQQIENNKSVVYFFIRHS